MEELSNAARNLQLESEENQNDGAQPPIEPQKDSKRTEVSNRQTDGQSRDLHGAVRRRDSYGIQRILVSSDNNTVNAKDDGSKTALHVAVQENCLQVKFIINQTVVDRGFSRRGGGGATQSVNLLFGKIFPENCMKI